VNLQVAYNKVGGSESGAVRSATAPDSMPSVVVVNSLEAAGLFLDRKALQD